jgi:hypothetical protein
LERVRDGIKRLARDVSMSGFNWIWFEQVNEQLTIVHCVMTNKDWAQFKSIFELIYKFWFGRNFKGFDKDDANGTSSITGAEQSRIYH